MNYVNLIFLLTFGVNQIHGQQLSQQLVELTEYFGSEPYNNQYNKIKYEFSGDTMFIDKKTKYDGPVWLRLLNEKDVKLNYPKSKDLKKFLKKAKRKGYGYYKPWINNMTIEQWNDSIITPLLKEKFSRFVRNNNDENNSSVYLDFSYDHVLSNVSDFEEITGNSYSSLSGLNSESIIGSNDFFKYQLDEKDLICRDYLMFFKEGLPTGKIIFFNRLDNVMLELNFLKPSNKIVVKNPYFNKMFAEVDNENKDSEYSFYNSITNNIFMKISSTNISIKNNTGELMMQYSKYNESNSSVLSFFQNGLLSRKINVKDNKKLIFDYYEGKLSRITCTKGNKKNGTQKSYFSNGNVEKVENYIDDELNGKYLEFNENGRLKVDGFFENGLKENIWTEYWYDESEDAPDGMSISKTKIETWENGIVVNCKGACDE